MENNEVNVAGETAEGTPAQTGGMAPPVNPNM